MITKISCVRIRKTLTIDIDSYRCIKIVNTKPSEMKPSSQRRYIFWLDLVMSLHHVRRLLDDTVRVMHCLQGPFKLLFQHLSDRVLLKIQQFTCFVPCVVRTLSSRRFLSSRRTLHQNTRRSRPVDAMAVEMACGQRRQRMKQI